MYVFLIVVPIINYLDKKINYIPTESVSSIVIVILYITTIVITAYLAIKHFINASKRRLDDGR